MKKIITSIILVAMIAIVAFSLSACNSATTQGQLANILSDHSQEHFVYDVLDTANNTTGTYTVDLCTYQKGSTIENFGADTLQNVAEGILVKGTLTIADITYQTGCYYTLINGSSYMVPAYSFRTQSENGNETFRLQANYDDGAFNYEKVIDNNTDQKQTGSIELSGTYYDNNEFHQSLRSVTTFSTAFSFSFALPLVDAQEASLATLTASCSSMENVKVAYTSNHADETIRENGLECYKVSISRSTEVAGTSQTLYYSKSPIVLNGWTITRALVKIVEPYKTIDGSSASIEYTLKEATLA